MLRFGERLAAAIDRLPAVVRRLLLPPTDVEVVAQVVLVAALLGWLWWIARRRPEWRLVVIGGGMIALGLFGLRAAH